MIADTVVVVLMCISSAQPIQEDSLYKEANRKIEFRHRLDSVSRVAGREADEKTKEARKKAIGDLYLWRREIEGILGVRWK